MKSKFLITTALVSMAFVGTAAAAAAEPTPLEGEIKSPINQQSIVKAGTTATGTDVTASGVSSETYGAVIVQRSKEGTPPESNGTLNLTGGTFSNNTAKKGDGGAISNYGNLNVNGTTFTNNRDHVNSDSSDSNPIGGGAIALGVDSVTNIENATFTGNTTGSRGGAIATRRTLQAGETGNNGSLTIKDSTFENNSAGTLASGLGGAIATNFNTEITGGTFKGNFATNGGGAIYLTGFVNAQNQTNVSDDKKAGNLTITGSTFKSNATAGQGGAILAGTNSQKLTITDADFDGNKASNGGGAIWSGSETEINGGSFTNNITTGTRYNSNPDGTGQDEGGGAIFVGGASKVTVNGSTFTGNTSGTVGGAIATRVTATIEDGSSSLDVSNATFEGNSATISGGAINVGNAGIAPTITNSTFTNNTSATGGAIYNKGNLTVTGGSFSGNEATAVGGAIVNSKGTLTVTDVMFSGNHSTHGGGAIYTNGSNPLTVTGGSFENNIAGYTPVGEEDAAAEVAAAAEVTGGNGGAILAGAGTTLSVDGTTFSGNQAIGSNDSGFGGAISSAATNATVTDATFENNQASVAGGAINTEAKMTVTDSSFTSNSSNNGGAIYNKGAELAVTGGSFTSNTSTGVGGAITNSGGNLTVTDADFSGNRAGTNGGAIYSNKASSTQGEHKLTITGGSFTNNEAGYSEDGESTPHNGGAIFAGQDTTLTVEGTSFEGNKASGNGGAVAADNTSTFTDVTFANNTAAVDGGAFYISGKESDKVTFAGNVSFENNTANGVQNDIHFGADNGTITVADNATLSLDGGISCAGDSCSTAKVEMGQNSTLNVYDDTKVATKVTGTNGSGDNNDFDINVQINAGTNSFDLANIFTQSGNASDLKDNVVTNGNRLFTFENEEGTVFAVQERSASDVASNLGVSGAEAETVLGIMRAKTNNPAFAKVQDELAELAQGETVDSGVISRAADALGADAAPVVRTRETMLSNTIFEAANDAMDDNTSAMIAQSQTHTLIDKAKFWVKGLFNYADKSNTSKARGFDIDTYGIAMGIDKEIGAGKVGLGYAYNKSDIDGYTRKTDAKTNSLFLYGKYNPADWYVKGIASYNWSNYKEKKTVLGENANSKYDVNTWALEGLYGYNFHVVNGLDVTPEAGLRYLHVKQDAATNALGVRVNARSLNVLTGVAGVKVAKNFTLSNGINIRPEARAALTYDLKTNKNNSIVTIPGGATYVVNGEKLERVGYELGAKISTDITSRFEIGAGYEARIRKDYVDHTGMLSAKYKF